MKTEVIRSQRRKKTVEARIVGDTIRILLPASLTREEEEHWVGEMVRRVERKTKSDHVDLATRAGTLARRYRLPQPTSIAVSPRQRARWGSCSPEIGAVRVSSQVLAFPGWVLDYVIVHELAHILEPNHTQRFWKLVNRYELTERARGFLIAMQSR
jgi:predicted metal-dependent hydrolase